MEVDMLRNEVAKKLGIDSETIRFYEKEKLISAPKRLDNGYRSYSGDHLIELKFIQHCRSLGIGLGEVKTLKELSSRPGDCSEAKEIIDKNIQLIETKMKELKALKTQLSSLSKSCFGPSDAKDCEIVISLANAAKGKDCSCHHSDNQ
jgi:DNA-binding transcriptional MerR regulator